MIPVIGRLPDHTQVEMTARSLHPAEDSVKDSANRVSDSIAGNLFASSPGTATSGRAMKRLSANPLVRRRTERTFRVGRFGSTTRRT